MKSDSSFSSEAGNSFAKDWSGFTSPGIPRGPELLKESSGDPAQLRSNPRRRDFSR